VFGFLCACQHVLFYIHTSQTFYLFLPRRKSGKDECFSYELSSFDERPTPCHLNKTKRKVMKTAWLFSSKPNLQSIQKYLFMNEIIGTTM
jgi:hypothetical protein